jgi:hypothetical protein
VAAAELSPVIPFAHCASRPRDNWLPYCAVTAARAVCLPEDCLPEDCFPEVQPVPGGVVNLPTGQEE